MLPRPRTLPAGFIQPCLPTKAAQLPSGALWLHEIKHDGFRVIARKQEARVRLYSRPGNDLTCRTSFLFDFPGRVMRDVHGRIAAGTSQCRHAYASKWLTPSDSLVLASAAGDDMRAAIHFRLRLVGVPSIKRGENLITIAVGQHAGAINVFLFA